MKTPHRASSLCCHETNDGRMTKINHTPSKKAGQLSRHSCNQIPRGRYQQTTYRAGPGHQTRQPAGEGKAKRTEKGAKNKRGQKPQDQKGQHTHSEERKRARKTRRRTNRSQTQRDPTSPAGQHKTTKGTAACRSFARHAQAYPYTVPTMV